MEIECGPKVIKDGECLQWGQLCNFGKRRGVYGIGLRLGQQVGIHLLLLVIFLFFFSLIFCLISFSTNILWFSQCEVNTISFYINIFLVRISFTIVLCSYYVNLKLITYNLLSSNLTDLFGQLKIILYIFISLQINFTYTKKKHDVIPFEIEVQIER